MREYVEKLIGRDEMRIVERTVDPRFELSGVLHASQQSSELPILFRSVKGSALGVVSNLYGSRRRLCELIGADDGNFPKRWLEITRAAQANTREFVTQVPAPGDLGPRPPVRPAPHYLLGEGRGALHHLGDFSRQGTG